MKIMVELSKEEIVEALVTYLENKNTPVDDDNEVNVKVNCNGNDFTATIDIAEKREIKRRAPRRTKPEVGKENNVDNLDTPKKELDLDPTTDIKNKVIDNTKPEVEKVVEESSELDSLVEESEKVAEIKPKKVDTSKTKSIFS